MLLKQTDMRLQSDYLVLWGNLKDGSYVYIKTALESIRESAAITNRFFAMIGLFGIISILLIVLVLLQSDKASSGAQIISGGNSDLFSNQKERGAQLFISRLTLVLGALFFVISFILYIK